MVDLSTLDGSSLVPTISGDFQKGIQEIFQDAAEKRAVENIAQGGQTEQEERASLLRLNQLDPQLAAGVQGVLQRRDDQEILALQGQADEAFKFSTFVGGIKNFHKQGLAIDARISELQADPDANPQRIQNLLKLKGMTQDQRSLAILKTKTMTADVKTVTEGEKTRVKNEKEAQEKRFVQNALSAQQVEAAGVQNQATMLENLAQDAERNNNSKGAQVWRDIALKNVGPERDFALQQIQNLAVDKITPTKPVEPKGDFAILNAQRAAGNITQAQFEQGIKNIQQAQKTGLIKDLTAAGFEFDENGVAKTPEGRQIIIDIKNKPAVVINSALKPETGFAPKDPAAWAAGDYKDGVEPIKGGTKGKLSPEQSAKVSMLVTAKRGMGVSGDVKGVDGLVYETKDKLDKNGRPILDEEGLPVQVFALDDDGNLNVDRVNVSQSWFGQGRELHQRMELGIQAITRGETGAAMPAEEVENTRIRFMPKILDSDKMIATKLRLFRAFINGTLKMIDPTGRFDSDKFNAQVDAQMGNAPRTKKEQDAQKSSGKVGKFSFTVE